MARVLVGAILGSIILFVWSAISWMALPWHMQTMHSFKNDTAIVEVIKANADKSGVYFLPAPSSQQQNSMNTEMKGPFVLAAVQFENMPAMTHPLGIQFIMELVTAFLACCLLAKTKGLGYFGRFGFIFKFSLAIAIMSYVPYWNWFGFSTDYTLVGMADIIISWFLAGIIMAAIVKGQPTNT